MKSVEDKFREYVEDTGEYYPKHSLDDWGDIWDAFKAGHDQGRQDLMSESVEGFDEWMSKQTNIDDPLDKRDFIIGFGKGFREACPFAWQAAKLSSAKEIEKLEIELDQIKDTPLYLKLSCLEDALTGKDHHIEKLEKQVGELKKHSEALYRALNSAHGYIDPRENKRTDKLCKEALCDFETYQEIKG